MSDGKSIKLSRVINFLIGQTEELLERVKCHRDSLQLLHDKLINDEPATPKTEGGHPPQ